MHGRNQRWLLFLAPLMVLLSMLACSFNASTANIKDVQMAKDEAGTQPTTTFSPTDTFYANVTLANAPSDTKVKAVWTAVKAEGAAANTQLDSSELTSGDGTLHFKLTNNQPWPAGDYKVDIYLNDKLDKTVTFTVQ